MREADLGIHGTMCNNSLASTCGARVGFKYVFVIEYRIFCVFVFQLKITKGLVFVFDI